MAARVGEHALDQTNGADATGGECGVGPLFERGSDTLALAKEPIDKRLLQCVEASASPARGANTPADTRAYTTARVSPQSQTRRGWHARDRPSVHQPHQPLSRYRVARTEMSFFPLQGRATVAAIPQPEVVVFRSRSVRLAIVNARNERSVTRETNESRLFATRTIRDLSSPTKKAASATSRCSSATILGASSWRQLYARRLRRGPYAQLFNAASNISTAVWFAGSAGLSGVRAA